MIRRARARVARSPVKLRRIRAGHTLARGAASFVAGFENRANWHIESNGEARLLEALAPFSPSTVFDVGANIGDWSLHASRYLPTSSIHAFEPVPTTCAQLREATGHLGARISVHELALGSAPERRLVSTDTKASHVSLVDHADPELTTSVAIEVMRGDDICASEGIGHIDLLKIDAEGTDHLVLGGFEHMLSNGAIDVIQFEYGVWALRTKYLLYDFYATLEAMGYTVGKLYPRGVNFAAYNTRQEDFRGLNFAAVRNERSDLVEALREN